MNEIHTSQDTSAASSSFVEPTLTYTDTHRAFRYKDMKPSLLPQEICIINPLNHTNTFYIVNLQNTLVSIISFNTSLASSRWNCFHFIDKEEPGGQALHKEEICLRDLLESGGYGTRFILVLVKISWYVAL